MAENQRKVNLDEIITNLIARLEEIRTRDKPQATKTRQEKAAAKPVHTALYTDGRKSDNGKLTVNTYNRYLSRIRKALADTGYKSHQFAPAVMRAAKKHPKLAAKFEAMLDMPFNDALAALTALRKEAIKKNLDYKVIESISSVRKSITPPIMLALAMNEINREDFKGGQASTIRKKQSRLTTLKIADIKDLIIKLLNTAKGHRNEAECLALGIAMATGRRQVEVVLRGDFGLVGRRAGDIRFSGQAKTKEDIGERIIPVLAPATLIDEAIKRMRATDRVQALRDELEGMTGDKLAIEFNARVRNFTTVARGVLLSTFGEKSTINEKTDKPDNWTFKDSRAIYAKTSYVIYMNKERKAGRPISTEDVYFYDKLGHTDVNAKESYKAFHVEIDSESDVTPVKAKEIRDNRLTPAQRLKELKAAAKHGYITGNKTYTNVMARIIERVTDNPEQNITKQWIRDDVKGGKTIRLMEVYRYIEKKGLLAV